MDFRQIYFLLFLCLQDQMEELTKQTQALNDKMQLMMEQIVLSNKSRFGRSSEKMTDPGQIRFHGSGWEDRLFQRSRSCL